jgi:hypothetical protein
MKLSRFRRPKATWSLLYVDYSPNTKQKYEKQVMLRGSHIQEGENKRRKLRK